MKKLLLPLFVIVLGLYICIFTVQEKTFKRIYKPLSPVPAASFLKIASGYGRQMVAEIFFIQSSVFLGGLPNTIEPESYGDVLAHNFLQIASLYPEFSDPYYFAQSYLTYISSELARKVNVILSVGRTVEPNNLIYPFFQAFNYFNYLSKPLQAAAILREASRLPDAPPMFNHLAVILEAEGGELEASLLSLQALLNSSSDKGVRKRYKDEIHMLRKALTVQKAVGEFTMRNQRYPAALDELVPDYLSALPDFGTSFELTYDPPRVGLIRPHRKKSAGK